MEQANQQPKRIKAQEINPIKDTKMSKRKTWASVCYYYPQYTLEDVSDMSLRDIRLLLSTAKKIEAQKMLELTQIVASPHTKKGKGVKKLIDYYKSKIDK